LFRRGRREVRPPRLDRRARRLLGRAGTLPARRAERPSPRRLPAAGQPDGRRGRRVVFGASAAIRHALAPDASSVSFASKADLTQHWIVALRVTLARDWTWDGLSARGVRVTRQGDGEVGRIEL